MTTERTSERLSEPGHRLRAGRRLRRYLLVVGPGLIAASAGNDAGGVVTYASAGAQFRYRTLFVMVLITYSGSLWFSGLHAYSGLN